MKDRERKEMMTKKKKTKGTKRGKSLANYCRPVCVASPRWHRLHFLFTNEGRGGGEEKRNLNSNVYFRFELIKKAKREGFQGGHAHCYAEIEMHKHSSRSSLSA